MESRKPNMSASVRFLFTFVVAVAFRFLMRAWDKVLKLQKYTV